MKKIKYNHKIMSESSVLRVVGCPTSTHIEQSATKNQKTKKILAKMFYETIEIKNKNRFKYSH